ncbi:ABC transporter ATP-binding protein/permease [Spiroplasma clarkii]|uniref:ABC transporter ATP-binding protein n=1 Tax=Spiroplasma clarkii TaxID=2139 RepID=A0A1Y0L279_9MOLU|nr:ABC transporter ATP-binding protein/permease [Spiroplasma clarkii]ARU92097.1 ABC transporter ATP-binding protein/permease [Spiroplasma clarkii]ATX71434.1 ABC transporter ATP-binding protein [Spiroplasma clarkii]
MKREKFASEKAFSVEKFKDVLKTINGGIKRHPYVFTCLILINIVDSMLFSSLVIVVKGITTAVVEQETNGGIASFWGLSLSWVGWAFAGLGVFCAMLLSGFLTNLLSMLFAKKVEIYLRQKALIHLVKIDISYYSKNQLGLIMSRVINDSQWFGDAFNEFFTNFVYTIATTVVTTSIVFGIDVTIGYIALGLLFALMCAIWVMFIFYRRAILIAVDQRQEIDADIIDRIINIRLIKATGTEERETKRNQELHKKYDVKQMRSVRFQSWMLILNGVFATAFPVFMLMITIVLYRSSTDPATLASLCVAVISAASSLMPNILLLTQSLRGMTRMANCVMRLNLIYKAKTLLDIPDDGRKICSIDSILFRNVSFSYPESPMKQILPCINLELEKGKSYAFVGETGVGKSTIAKMLLRFYDTTEGELLINGINIKELDLPQYLSMVGYVEQEPQIIYGTVIENLAYGLTNVTDEEVKAAAQKANLHDIIMTLPQGYHTILGERGFMFSGGQKQRLIIARLFLKNPQLLILDEATSALDNIVEAEIQAELNNLMQGRTTVVIAHRLSTIKNVDRVIVLDKTLGISQIGTFDELKKAPGRFKKLYEYGLLK